MKTLRPLATSFPHSTWRASQCRPGTFLTSGFAAPTRPDSKLSRTFISNPFGNSQTITASRVIDYPLRSIYDVISDVKNYSAFLPYCQSSKVTKTSSPSSVSGKTYPEEAELLIGFNDSVSESFWSRVYCAPYETIETVAGPETETSLASEKIEHHSQRPSADQDPTRSGKVLSHLRTTWNLRTFPYKLPPKGSHTQDDVIQKHAGGTHAKEHTEVSLVIEYQFANPVYAALSQAAAPKVAEKVMEAFERRLQLVLVRS